MAVSLSNATMNPTDEPSRPTRRSLLRAGALAATTGLTASAAGCTGLPPLGSKPSYGRVDVPDAGPPDYRRWLPSQSVVETDDDWLITYAEPGPFDGPVPEEFVARRGYHRAELDYFGIGYENYDRLVTTNLATVIEAEFAADEVAATLADTAYEPDGSYRDYDLYARSDVPRRVAVRDGVVVWTSSVGFDATNLEATIDAGRGDVERYHEADDDFAAVTEAVGASRLLYVGSGHPGLATEYATMGADAFRISDASYQILLERYPEGQAVPAGRIRRILEDEPHELTSEAETADVGVEGRLARVEARVPLAPDRDRDPIRDPPQVTWGASFDADARTVTIRHEAGEEVDADWLWYDVDFPDDYGEIAKEPLWSERDAVGPGDRATIDLSDGPDADGIQLVYGPEGIGSRTLFYYRLEGDE
ncbi:hypothetical protein SAMN05216559_3343 [Halomicrobium zhouii]|uniref:Uncharacterized protein n=2 Tax=Halomicrobium zhouii TaxID=767519 RepID=A0A1I6LXN4_9EURY|nr:hypothetical protein SAMN05216559_3343 [Halomicrobium zhouii]